MLLEFGTFAISIGTFLLVLFYTRNNKTYIKKYFYTLLIPVIYVFFIIFPSIAIHSKLVADHFLGFTGNPNIISKILIIPTIFFITKTLFESKNKLYKIVYFLLSFLLVSLLLWTNSRGAILSLILGTILLLIIFSFNNFNWKKLVYSGVIIFLIFSMGFIFTPNKGRQLFLNRIINSSKIININNKQQGESRFKIWSFYFKKVSVNPLGFGPDTHMPSYILLSNGQYDNTGPHNTYIQIWLWGGLLGLLSFIYLLITAFKNLKIKLKANFNYIIVALISILFALSVSIVFDDSLSFYWFWIVLAFSFLI